MVMILMLLLLMQALALRVVLPARWLPHAPRSTKPLLQGSKPTPPARFFVSRLALNPVSRFFHYPAFFRICTGSPHVVTRGFSTWLSPSPPPPPSQPPSLKTFFPPFSLSRRLFQDMHWKSPRCNKGLQHVASRMPPHLQYQLQTDKLQEVSE